MSTEQLLITPTVNDLPAPKPLRLDSYEFPPAQQLFQSSQEAHDAMMEEIEDVLAELKADGEPIPPFPKFYRMVRRLWSVWSCYAPR